MAAKKGKGAGCATDNLGMMPKGKMPAKAMPMKPASKPPARPAGKRRGY